MISGTSRPLALRPPLLFPFLVLEEILAFGYLEAHLHVTLSLLHLVDWALR